MKKIYLLLIALLAASNVLANNLKIGTVNISTILDKAPQVADSSRKIAEEFGPKENEVRFLVEQLETMQAKYQQNKSIMSADQARKKERDITNQQKRIQRRRGDLQEEINAFRNEELQTIQALINEAIQTVAERDKYDLILYEGIGYNNERADISPLVLNQLESLIKK